MADIRFLSASCYGEGDNMGYLSGKWDHTEGKGCRKGLWGVNINLKL